MVFNYRYNLCFACFTVEVVVDVRLLTAEIFSFRKPQQNGSVNSRPSKQKLIQTNT